MSYEYITVKPTITKKTSIADTNPISSSDVATWLRISDAMATLESDNITRLINTATEVFEKYLWINLRRTEYQAYYLLDDGTFGQLLSGTLRLMLERAPILSLDDITAIEYLDDDGEWQEFDRGDSTADGIYENTTERIEQRDWASVYFNGESDIDYDYEKLNAYKIRVTFIAGFTVSGTDDLTDIPSGLETALLMTVADYYTNRGDCSGDCSMGGFPVPCGAKSIADMYSVANTVIGSSGNSCGLC